MNDTALQSLINKYQVPDYSGVNIPSGTLSKWDIPQFGFYGSELMKQYGIGAKPGASVGMPGSYYTKYGASAEPRFLSEMLLGQYGPGTAGSLQSAFSGGLPSVLKNISGIALPFGAGEYYRSGISQHAGIKGVSDYIYLMSALAGVGAGKSPWLSMLPGVPAIPYPTDAKAVQDILNLGPKKFGMVKHHSGGLLADETMAILQAGEAVIPKRSVSMNRDLIDGLISGGGRRFHEGGIAGSGQSSAPSITINVENRGSNPVNVTQGPTVVSQGRILATMVIDEIRRNPNMRNALR